MAEIVTQFEITMTSEWAGIDMSDITEMLTQKLEEAAASVEKFANSTDRSVSVSTWREK